MGRKRAHVPLDVFLNSRLVGVLRRQDNHCAGKASPFEQSGGQGQHGER
jgi:hypothetical protein